MSYTTWLTINRNCNLSCKWCYQGSGLSSNYQMPLATAKKLIDLSIGVGAHRIIILGGEPTIHPKIAEIVECSRSVETSLLTNGILFANKDYCKRLENAGLRRVSTSLKCATESEYATHCGKEMFEKVMAGIENLEASTMRHQISVTVCVPTIKHWGKMMEVIRTCGAKDFTFSFERPVVRGEDVSFDDRMLPGNMVQFIEEVMYPSLKTLGVRFDLNLTFPQCHFSEGFVNRITREGHAIAGCQLLMSNGIIFDPEGKVLPCNHLLDHPLGAFGKDFTTPLEFSTWRKSSPIARFYEAAGAPPGSDCRDCVTWSRCGAGCRMYWLYSDEHSLVSISKRKEV